MKPKILVTQKIFPAIAEKLHRHFRMTLLPQEVPLASKTLAQKAKDADGIFSFLTDKLGGDFLEKTPRLKIIANFAVGFDNVDLVAATAKDIFVCNTPNVLTEATADLTWALLLATVRRIPQADQFTRAGKFKCWRHDLFLGSDLSGKTLGILGLGKIGKAVARRAKSFGMDVIYFDAARIEDNEDGLEIRFVDFDELLRRSDILTIHCALTKATFHMIGSKEIALMKSGAYIINTARGPIIDEKALVQALKSKRLAGAGLDVYEQEPVLTPGLSTLPNVVCLPHIGSATKETRLAMANMAADSLIAFFRGTKPPPNCVNPQVAHKKVVAVS